MIGPDTLPERPLVQCPRCGAPLAPALGVRRKKVQCPKCLEVITARIGSSAAPPVPDLAELRARVEKCEALEQRVELLEQRLEWLLDHRPAAEASLLRPGQKLQWLRGIQPAWTGTGDPLSEPQCEALLHNLRALRTGEVSLQIAAENSGAGLLGGQLKQIFRQAAWRVREISERPLPRGCHGLALFAGSCPSPPSLAAASMALTAAGLAADSGFDPSLEASQVVLAVGPISPPAAEGRS